MALIKTALGKILTAARHADITRQLPRFSRQRAVYLRELNLDATLAGMLMKPRQLIDEEFDHYR